MHRFRNYQTSLWLGGYLPDSSQDLFLKTHRSRIIWMDSIARNFLVFLVQLFFWGGVRLRWSNRDAAAGEFKQLTEKETGRRVTGPGRSRRRCVRCGVWVVDGNMNQHDVFHSKTVGKNVSGFRVKNGEHVQVMHVFYCFLLFFFQHIFFGEKQHGDITAITSYAPRYLDRGLFGRWFFGGIKRPGLVQVVHVSIWYVHLSIWAAFKAFKFC